MNVLGGVAINPIDEIFFERRGAGTVKLYQASLEWNERWFSLTGFYREGHYHWGYEGDFFGIYPEANYQGAVDQFNADTPSGLEVAGHRALEGFKVAFGPELYWGANPSVIAKFDRKFGAFEVAAIHQQDIAQRAGAGTSSVLPLPQTAKSTLYVGWQRGGLKLEWGGIVAGYDRIGRAYQLAVPGTGATYLNSGSYVLDDTIRWYDTLGTKAKLTWTGGRVQLYAQGGYRGLVADSSGDQTLTLTGWRLRETGQGNHWHAIAGATIAVTSAFQVAPNVLYQKPLAGPLPTMPDFYEPRSGTYFPGLVARNQLKDPFWVRSNRETLGGELLLVFDPTPASFFWQWNNAQKENAPFAASLSFVYRHQPTARDAGLAVLATGQVFAFPGSNPAQDVWELWGRFVVNAGPMHMAGTAWAGTGQANGVDPRLVTRGGLEARLDVSRLTFTGTVKLNDWGPFDYYRDFNLTFPLQLTGDVAWTLGTPRWFYPNQTKLGAMAKYRTLDQYSPRGDLAVVTRSNYGTEWEVKTYVRFSL
jgi:beta-galactosidase